MTAIAELRHVFPDSLHIKYQRIVHLDPSIQDDRKCSNQIRMVWAYAKTRGEQGRAQSYELGATWCQTTGTSKED